jgi:hypothetical protein
MTRDEWLWVKQITAAALDEPESPSEWATLFATLIHATLSLI